MLADYERKPSADLQGIIPDFCKLPRLFMLVLLSELLALLFTLLTFRINQSFWLQLGVHSTFILWVSLFSGAILCGFRSHINRLNIPQVTAITTASVTLVTLGTSLLAIAFFFGQSVDLSSPEHRWFLFKNTLCAILITLVWMRYLYLRQQVMLRLVSEGEARFKALQARIQPHFLFNTINTIASLIHVNADTAEATLQHLAELMRSSLKPAAELVPLSTELELCENYLAIESQRLADKLNVDWQVTIDTDKYLLPPFTIQPLIENAVYHGIQKLALGGTITIIIGAAEQHKNPGALKIVIINPLDPTIASKGNQTAQENIKQRLAIRYGRRANMTVKRSDNSYQITLIIPGKQQ